MRNRLQTVALSVFVLTTALAGSAQAAEPPHSGPPSTYASLIMSELATVLSLI